MGSALKGDWLITATEEAACGRLSLCRKNAVTPTATVDVIHPFQEARHLARSSDGRSKMHKQTIIAWAKFEGVRRYESVSHAIYYRPTQSGILILRVLHGRMDPARHLG